jgi:hypothetical protein
MITDDKSSRRGGQRRAGALSLHPLTLEQALRGAAATGPYEEPRQRRKRQPDEPTTPHPEETGDPVERAKDAMHKAGERNRRVKRPGASGVRGGISVD